MAEYRRPFSEPGEGRRPTLTWPRQIPVEGEPADVSAIATAYADWLGESNVPQLFLKAEPGAVLANDSLVNLVRGWPVLTEVTVAGIPFVQEDSPDELGELLSTGWGRWAESLARTPTGRDGQPAEVTRAPGSNVALIDADLS